MKLFVIIASLFFGAQAFAGWSDTTDQPPASQEGCKGWTTTVAVGDPEMGQYINTVNKHCINTEAANYQWDFRYKIGDKSAGVSVRSSDFPEDEFVMKKFIVLNTTEGISPEVADFEFDVIKPLLAGGTASSLLLAQQKWSAEIHRLALIGYPQPK